VVVVVVVVVIDGGESATPFRIRVGGLK